MQTYFMGLLFWTQMRAFRSTVCEGNISHQSQTSWKRWAHALAVCYVVAVWLYLFHCVVCVEVIWERNQVWGRLSHYSKQRREEKPYISFSIQETRFTTKTEEGMSSRTATSCVVWYIAPSETASEGLCQSWTWRNVSMSRCVINRKVVHLWLVLLKSTFL